MRIPTTVAALAVAACSLVLAGCGGQTAADWSTQSIQGVMPDLQFNLTNEHNQPVTAASFKGDVTLLFFGYTHCPDVCPATLALLSAARQALGPDASDVKILFVSVDPKRDDPQTLAQYTSNFGPGVVGLTGTKDQLTTLTKRYRVAYRYDTPDKNGNYLVYHSAGVFGFGPDGKARILMTFQDGLPAIEHDLKQLVSLSTT